MHPFTCDACHGEFDTSRTDDECAAEFAEQFPGEPLPPPDNRMELCSDCYDAFRVWFAAQPAERLRRMREARH